MARLQATWWQRKKYVLHAVVLALPVWFIYQSLNPQHDPKTKQISHLPEAILQLWTFKQSYRKLESK